MINPFTLRKNKRYTLNDRTIIVEDFSPFSVIYYYLDKWWKTQPIKPVLIKSGIINFIFNVKKYKFTE